MYSSQLHSLLNSHQDALSLEMKEVYKICKYYDCSFLLGALADIVPVFLCIRNTILLIYGETEAYFPN